MKTTLAILAVVAIAANPTIATAQLSTYDSTTGVLSIPSVGAGGASFTNVTLKANAQLVFTLQGATAQVPVAPGVARYDATTRLLTLPAVKVGSDTLLNVTLRDNGNYNFSLQGATPLAADTLNGVSALLAAVDAQFATAVPATGAVRLQHADSCYLHDGRSRAWLVSETDGNPTGIGMRDAYRIGQSTSNIEVLAERVLANADGSTRHEVDVQYEQRFKDGSIARNVQQTLVTGSTRGMPRCSAPQSSSQWRLLGNQRLVEVGIRPRNIATQLYKLADGTAQTPRLEFRRELRFWITDPLGHATYVVVTGPRTVNGAPGTMSLKLLSPRVARSAPEMAGKTGNTLNWLDDDNFRLCLTASSTSSQPASASVASCAGQGVGGDNWGSTAINLDTSADVAFDALGFMPGGTFLFAIYADDGWKTVNGHAGRTPIATYTATLRQLPYTFASMADGHFPVFHFDDVTTKQMRNNLVSATPAPLKMRWTPPALMADNRAFRMQQIWEFFAGAPRGASTYYPNYRYLHRWYPGSTVTQFDLPITATPATMQRKESVELMLQFVDRNDAEVLSSMQFN